MISIGLDIGGTKVLGVAIDPAAPTTLLAMERVPTPEGGEGLVDSLVDLIAALTATVGPPEFVGVGVPGLLDRSGRLHIGPHLRRLQNLPLADLLAERLGMRPALDNDANCHAIAEQGCGAAAGAQEALMVTFGTGIGAGIITGGRVVRGANGFAGEPGHMVVSTDGPACPCGKSGCWERFASGTGLARLARIAARDGRLDGVVLRAGGDPSAVEGEHVTAAARDGDEEALALLDDLAGWIALGLVNLANILDPEVIVFGGGLVDAADLLLPGVRRRFVRLVMAGEQRPDVPIRAAALGERAGAIGAAVLAAQSP